MIYSTTGSEFLLEDTKEEYVGYYSYIFGTPYSGLEDDPIEMKTVLYDIRFGPEAINFTKLNPNFGQHIPTPKGFKPTPTPKHRPSQWTIGLQPPVNDPMETTAEEATVDHTVVDAVKEEEIIAWKDFFAAHGTNDLKGKHVIQDAMPFNIDTFYRKRDKHSGRDGVSLLMARRDDDHGTQEAIAVFFDRSKFTEEDAADWWMHNKVRFPYHQ